MDSKSIATWHTNISKSSSDSVMNDFPNIVNDDDNKDNESVADYLRKRCLVMLSP